MVPARRNCDQSGMTLIFRKPPILSIAYRLFVLVTGAAVFSAVAHAERLQVPAEAPVWAHLGAGFLLSAHIGGGAVGLVSGATAIASRKGGVVHVAAGKVFLISMFITYLIGAGVAPFLELGQRPNFVAGILALYLLISGWLTVRRPGVRAGMETYIGLAAALVIASLGLVFMHMGAASPSGTVDGAPSEAFILFAVAGSAAAAGELNIILRRTITGAARLSRHLWRICVSMFFASGSLFLGQPHVFPDGFNETALPVVLAFAPLIAMAVWLVLVRLRQHRRRATA